MYMQPQVNYYNAPYPVYYPAAVDCAQIPSPTSSASQYSNSPSPLNYSVPHPSATNYAVQTLHQPYQHQCQTQQPHPHTQPIYAYPTPDTPTDADPAPYHSRSRPQKGVASSRPIQIAHPYARLFAKKDEVKRRKIWNHALEKSIFSPYELSTLGAPQRRTIYMASLEAHIDRLHAQLYELGFWPVEFSELEPFKGLNSKTAKSMVAGLQHDASVSKLKLLELERANGDLEKVLSNFPSETES